MIMDKWIDRCLWIAFVLTIVRQYFLAAAVLIICLIITIIDRGEK